MFTMSGSQSEMNNLKALVYEAIGEGSMCWEKPEGAGTFDSEAADRVAANLFGKIRDSILYHYEATVTRIVDGDTIDVDIDMGFGCTIHHRLRLARINAPEVRGVERQEGLAAKEWIETFLPIGSVVMIRTYKDDSFGRYIAEIWVSEWQNLSDMIVNEGHAEYKEY